MQDLKERRAAMGLSQTTFARKCGCSRQTITNIECGRQTPGMDLLRRIEKALDDTESWVGREGLRFS